MYKLQKKFLAWKHISKCNCQINGIYAKYRRFSKTNFRPKCYTFVIEILASPIFFGIQSKFFGRGGISIEFGMWSSSSNRIFSSIFKKRSTWRWAWIDSLSIPTIKIFPMDWLEIQASVPKVTENSIICYRNSY